MTKPRTADLIHWSFLALTLALPFLFAMNLLPAFMPVKTSLFVAFAGLLGILAVRWLKTRERIVFGVRHEHLYLAGFIAWLFLSIFWSPDMRFAFGEWLPFASAFWLWLLYGIFYGNEDPDNRRQFELIQAIVLVGMLEAVIVLIQYFGLGLRFSDDAAGKWRVIGTLGNPNYVAEFLVPVFFLALNLLHHEPRSTHRRFYTWSLFLILLAVAATWSRSGMLLLGGGLVVYAWLFIKNSGQRFRDFFIFFVLKARRFIALAAAALFLILVIFPLLRIDRVLLQHATNTESITGRVFIWEHTLDAFVDKFPFGAGIGGFAAAWNDAQYRHFKDGETDGVNHAWVNDRAHNEILQFAVEAGLPSILLLLFLIRILRKGARSFRRDDFSLGVFIALLAMLGSSLVNFPLRVAPNLWLFMILVAIVSQHRRLDDEKPLFEIRTPRCGRPALLVALALGLFAFYWSATQIAAAGYLRQGDSEARDGAADAALESLESSVACDPANSRALTRLAGLYAAAGRLVDADEAAARALDILPFPDDYRVRASVACERNDSAQIEKMLRYRCFMFRKIPSYAADYIRTLADNGRGDEAIRETKLLNRIVNRIDLESESWYDAVVRANGTAVAVGVAKGGMRLVDSEGVQATPSGLPGAATAASSRSWRLPVGKTGWKNLGRQLAGTVAATLRLDGLRPGTLGVAAFAGRLYAADAQIVYLFDGTNSRHLAQHHGAFCGFASGTGGLAFAVPGGIRRIGANGTDGGIVRGLTNVSALGFSGDDLVTGSRDGTVRLTGAAGGGPACRLPRPVTCLAADEGAIYAGTAGAGVAILDPRTLAVRRMLDRTQGLGDGRITGIVAAHGRVLVATAENGVYAFAPANGSLLHHAFWQGDQLSVRALTALAEPAGLFLAAQADNLLVLGPDGQPFLALAGGPDWPAEVRGAAILGRQLVLAGSDGTHVYKDLDAVLKPYLRYLGGRQ